MTDVIKTSKRRKQKTLPIAAIRADIQSALDVVSEKHSTNPGYCLGYMWATFAGMMEKCGEPKPIAPWETKP